MFDLVDSLFSFYKTKMLMFRNISHDMSCSEWMCSNRELVQCFRRVIQFAYHYWNSLWITALQCHIASLIDCNLSPVFAYFTIWNYIVGHIVMLTRMNLVVLVYYILINIICSSICRNCLLHSQTQVLVGLPMYQVIQLNIIQRILMFSPDFQSTAFIW